MISNRALSTAARKTTANNNANVIEFPGSDKPRAVPRRRVSPSREPAVHLNTLGGFLFAVVSVVLATPMKVVGGVLLFVLGAIAALLIF